MLHVLTLCCRPSPPGPPATATAAADAEVIGHSARGTPIRAIRVGPARARVKVLVVGSIHGNEHAGRAVVRPPAPLAAAARHRALADRRP